MGRGEWGVSKREQQTGSGCSPLKSEWSNQVTWWMVDGGWGGRGGRGDLRTIPYFRLSTCSALFRPCPDIGPPLLGPPPPRSPPARPLRPCPLPRPRPRPREDPGRCSIGCRVVRVPKIVWSPQNDNSAVIVENAERCPSGCDRLNGGWARATVVASHPGSRGPRDFARGLDPGGNTADRPAFPGELGAGAGAGAGPRGTAV